MTVPKHFQIAARAILTWGRESIKDRITAVIELVKNSYDAVSKIAEIRLRALPEDPDSRELRISDAGEGMSEADVDTKWLRIGYPAKLDEPMTRQGRRKTGEKGVGRISADRLGEVLELRSQRVGHPAYRLVIDWTAFEGGGTNIEEIGLEPLSEPASLGSNSTIRSSGVPRAYVGSPHGSPHR